MRLFILALTISALMGGFSPAYADMADKPVVRLQMLDKSTARTSTIEAGIDQTLQFGSLFIKPRACRTSGPFDRPEDAAFLQTWEVPIAKEKPEWVFSGWMFSSSPALSAMDHPVYDVWVLDCFDPAEPVQEAPQAIAIVDGEEVDLDDEAQSPQSVGAAEEGASVSEVQDEDGNYEELPPANSAENEISDGEGNAVQDSDAGFDRMMESILGPN